MHVLCLLRFWVLVGATFLLPLFLHAQGNKISGTVLDDQGKPIAGASVLVKNTSVGTNTNDEGTFSINAAPNSVLVISSVGYETLEQNVGTQQDVTVVLKSAQAAMDEVVVVGYGTQKKVNLTGSVATVSAKQLADRPITNVSSAIGGLMPGVFVRQGSGDPRGDGANIQIRGTGTLSSTGPLVLVDGVIGSMDAVNPNDIESVSVLKDAASASIYGTLAANGVILITTKKGTKNRTTVNYSGGVSFTRPMNLPKFVTNYAEHMRLVNEGHINVGSAPIFSDQTIIEQDSASKIPNQINAVGVPNYIAYPNTDWADALYGKSRILQNHTVSVNGGSDKATYLASFGYLDNPGSIENTGLKRYQLRANIEAKVAKFLTVGTQTFGLTQLSQMGNTESAFNFLPQTTPGVVPYYDGRYGFAQAPGESGTANNILGFLNNTAGDDQTTRLNTTLYTIFTILKGLSFESRMNYQFRQNEYNSHANAGPSERWNFRTNGLMSPLPALSNLTTYYSFNKDYRLTFDNVLRYTTTIKNDHDIGALFGYNQWYVNWYNFNGTKRGLIDYNITTPGSAVEPVSINGTEYDDAMRSWFGRVNYGYKGKYLLEGNLRYDGSSRFSPETRWGVFPSMSAGWRISEEGFMQGTKDWLSNLKLKASWGKTGNVARRYDDINDPRNYYIWQSFYDQALYSFNGSQVAGLAQSVYANRALQWETSTATNFGLEGGLWKNKLTLELDVYRRYTYGILTVPPIPLTAGTIAAPIENTADVVNKGIELMLGYRGKAGDFTFNVSGNISYNTNEVVKYKGKLVEGFDNGVYRSNLGDVSTGGTTRRLEDHKVDEYYLYKVYSGSGTYFNTDGSVNINGGPKDGMIRTPEDLAWAQAMLAAGHPLRPSNAVRNNAIWYGDLIYADLNGDGDYGNSFDRYFTGTSSLPKFVFGLNATVTWKQFDLSMIWAGATGHQYYWNDVYNNSSVRNGFALPVLYGRDHYFYDPANTNDPRTNITSSNPRLRSADPQNAAVASDHWLHDATWIKLKNLQVGYNLPSDWAGKVLMQRARIYFSGENVLLITKFKGLDPEIGTGTTYPTMKQFSFGLNLTF
ncbi:MAG TPA: TonB-dependent receptor [Niabella sp.]|nr:TonB-dependent receptor [Niabella sp.]